LPSQNLFFKSAEGGDVFFPVSAGNGKNYQVNPVNPV
jgi:hypothetical protein